MSENIHCIHKRFVFMCNLVRLVASDRNSLEGRLEVYYNGTWGTVCNDRISDATAKVVCNSLGFGYVVFNSTAALFSSVLNSFGRRCFAVAGPSTCNSLPDSLRDPALSLNMFRRQLKPYLFLEILTEMYSAH